jgi:LPPG:FO 2-phospho-L-lactate transferase
MTSDSAGTVVALAGGVGGAKLADGLARLLGQRLTVVVNTGDDFNHLGLHISPDLDTVMYTLAGIANPHTGWGIAGETRNFMGQIERLGGPTWFRLGDRDLATHIVRTLRLAAGETLSTVTADLCRSFGVAAKLLPMSDDPVRTMIRSDDGELPFQDYFVRLACAVPVRGIRYEGAQTARINPALAAPGDAPGVGASGLSAIIICPSNPYLSVDPILALSGMREWLRGQGRPIVAVSPIVGGAAVKGPAAKIMAEFGATASAAGIARHYRGLVEGLVIDEADADLAEEIAAEGMAVRVAPTIMSGTEGRVALARICLAFAAEIAKMPRR